MSDPQMIIGCGILEKEIRYLAERNNWSQELIFIPSGLHVDFDKLRNSLEKCLQQYKDKPAAVFYGTCHPCMDEILAGTQRCRTPGQNCVDIYLGHDRFSQELQQGAFFLFEDWALHWNDIVGAIMPGDPDIMRSIFRSAHKYLLAIRTPCSGDFTAEAEAISDMTALELRWIDIGLENLEENLRETLNRVRMNTTHG
ncbi:DUF1638 domain-containing protein [Pelobacter seleniigenes]|uniref:DUF1638 domain-containing protein n=1 Tax=Pelobacter seleniigenes TaxID=407188 RepID=UPI000568B407|nr:DUF1638 domain-containing protein [Pelobacter seleniigenes]